MCPGSCCRHVSDAARCPILARRTSSGAIAQAGGDTLTGAAVGEDTSEAPEVLADALACSGNDTGPPVPVALTSQARVDMEEAGVENREARLRRKK